MIKEPLKQTENRKLSNYKVIDCVSNGDKSFLVKFEGGFSEIFNASEVLKYDLYCKDEEGKVTLSELIDEIGFDRAYMVGLNFSRASRKPSSLVEEKLYNLHFSEKTIGRVISVLTNDGYLDDYQYAKKFAEKKLSQMTSSKIQIVMLLQSKGIDRELSKKVLDELDVDEEEIATKIAVKLAESGADCDKVIRSLASKGFNRNITEKAVEKAFPEE